MKIFITRMYVCKFIHDSFSLIFIHLLHLLLSFFINSTPCLRKKTYLCSYNILCCLFGTVSHCFRIYLCIHTYVWHDTKVEHCQSFSISISRDWSKTQEDEDDEGKNLIWRRMMWQKISGKYKKKLQANP